MQVIVASEPCYLSYRMAGRESAYAAQGLSKSERNFSITRKELLALVWGAEHFEAYLYGKTFVARTDHRALHWLKNFKNPKAGVSTNIEVGGWKKKVGGCDEAKGRRP